MGAQKIRTLMQNVESQGCSFALYFKKMKILLGIRSDVIHMVSCQKKLIYFVVQAMELCVRLCSRVVCTLCFGGRPFKHDSYQTAWLASVDEI